MAPSINPSDWTYTDYVCFLRSHGFHNLGLLDEYLQWGSSARTSTQVRQPETSRTTLLEFTGTSTRTSDLSDLSKLRLLLHEWNKPKSELESPTGSPSGRIVMVENIAPALVDTIGGILNIDPTFFASHLEDPGLVNFPDSSTSPMLPATAISKQRDFFTIEYISAFMPLGCGKEVDGLILQCKGNYTRKIELLQKQGKQKVALTRRKISFFSRKTEGPWLCVVLVDPPLSNFSIGTTPFHAIGHSQHFDVIGFQGGYLDFIEMRKPYSRQHHDFRDCRKRATVPNAFDDLIRHWQIQVRDGLVQDETVTLSTIMRPAFQIAASESGNFLEYIHSTLESQNLTTSGFSDSIRIRRNLDKCIFLDTMLMRYKPVLSRIKDYVHASADLKEDFRCLLVNLHHYRSVCDSHIQHVISVLQSNESNALQDLNNEAGRRSDYMRYLTIIALIYVPFALACAIFSMPHEFVPAAHYLSGFIPVTAGVTVLFLFLVLPESRDRLPNMQAVFCGKLSRNKLVKRQIPGSRDHSKRFGMEEV